MTKKVRFEINVYIFVFDIVLRIKEFAIHLLMSLFIVFSPFFSGGPVVLRNLNLVTSVKFKKIINYSTTQIYANYMIYANCGRLRQTSSYEYH